MPDIQVYSTNTELMVRFNQIGNNPMLVFDEIKGKCPDLYNYARKVLKFNKQQNTFFLTI